MLQHQRGNYQNTKMYKPSSGCLLKENDHLLLAKGLLYLREIPIFLIDRILTVII